MKRTWTLNSRHGYYVKTGLPDREIDLELRYKLPNGGEERAGRFRLDLPDLVDRGVVTRRRVAGSDVFDVKIVRDPDGSYWLAVRSERRVALRGLLRG